MTIDELCKELQDICGRRDGGRTVRMAVGGVMGEVSRLDWRYGDLVLVADCADEPVRAGKAGAS